MPARRRQQRPPQQRRAQRPARRRPRGETREKIYRYVRGRLLAGQPPTVREVQHAVGLKAVESARVHLARLVADGRLAKDPSVSRGYRLPPGEAGRAPTVMVPLLGLVQAGGLTAAIEAPEGHVPVAGRAVTRRVGALLALRVQGDSMKDAGILENDIVIVRRDVTPKSGDIVVALVDGEATVKTLQVKPGRQKKKRRVTLLPANSAYDPIVPDPNRLEILGRVVEVRRSLGVL